MTDLIKAVLAECMQDLAQIEAQLEVMRKVKRSWKHKEEIKKLAIENISLLNQQRREALCSIKLYQSFGKRRKKLLQKEENAESQNSPQV